MSNSRLNSTVMMMGILWRVVAPRFTIYILSNARLLCARMNTNSIKRNSPALSRLCICGGIQNPIHLCGIFVFLGRKGNTYATRATRTHIYSIAPLRGEGERIYTYIYALRYTCHICIKENDRTTITPHRGNENK